ncbi:MAG: GNAT family N-acetyltransferase [Luteibaculum sp.]
MDSLTIRAVEPEDLDWVYAMENNSDTWQVSDSCMPLSRFTLSTWLASTQDIYEHKFAKLMVLHDEKPVGSLDICDIDFYHQRAKVGIWVDANYRKKGVAKFALQWLANHAKKQLGLHNLFAEIGSSNHASIELFKSCNYKKMGTLNKALRVGTETWEDLEIYQLSLTKR